ncbi:hypothetical protein RDABS01_002540, partial [Bienertia sinuspersici]
MSGVKSQLHENAQQIATLTTLVSKLASNESKARVCGICSDLYHTNDACIMLQIEDVNALGGFPGQPQRKYDPFSSTYNEGWHDHPNLRYGPKGYGVKYQQKTDTHLQNIDTQIGLICTSLSNLESQLSGKLPSQPHPYPKELVNRVLHRESEEVNGLEELEFTSEESNTKHESTSFVGRPCLKTSKALIDVANGSVVLESDREKIELNMIDKAPIPEANATDYVANYLEQIGVDNLETILDGMVAEM